LLSTDNIRDQNALLFIYDLAFNNSPELIFHERHELIYEMEMMRPSGPDFSFYHKDTEWAEDEIPIEPHSGDPIYI
jgi:hypothetical protein